jgi:hypothetical protein
MSKVSLTLTAVVLAGGAIAAQVRRSPSLEEFIARVTGAVAVDCGTFSLIHKGMAMPPRRSSKARTKPESMDESLSCAREALKDHKGFKIVQRGPGFDTQVASGVLGNSGGTTVWFVFDSGPCAGCDNRFETRPCPLEKVAVVQEQNGNHSFRCSPP